MTATVCHRGQTVVSKLVRQKPGSLRTTFLLVLATSAPTSVRASTGIPVWHFKTIRDGGPAPQASGVSFRFKGTGKEHIVTATVCHRQTVVSSKAGLSLRTTFLPGPNLAAVHVRLMVRLPSKLRGRFRLSSKPPAQAGPKAPSSRCGAGLLSSSWAGLGTPIG